MPTVIVENVSTAGLESSPFADALAGLRANEARYFMNSSTTIRGDRHRERRDPEVRQPHPEGESVT